MSGIRAAHAVARPAAASARDRLLRAGAAAARRDGLRALTVRGVCERAGANLGSFVYHFGSRDAFVGEVIERWYAPLLGSLAVTVDRDAPPLARLRGMLLQMADWLAAHRRFITHLLMDAADGEPAAARFVGSLAGRHPVLVLRVIAEAQAARALPAAPPINVLLYLMGAIALPVLLADRLGASRLVAAELSRTLQSYAHERAFRVQRLDWALAGLAQEKQHDSVKSMRRRRSR